MAQEKQGTKRKQSPTGETAAAPKQETARKATTEETEPTLEKSAARKKGSSQETERGREAEATPEKSVTSEESAAPEKSVTLKKSATLKNSAGPKKAATSSKEATPGAASARKPAGTPTREPVAVPAEPTGAPAEEPWAENPIHRKLGLRPGIVGLVIAPPEDHDNPLLPLPDGFKLLTDVEAVSALEGQVDYLHFFARNRGELARVFAQLRDKLAPGGSLWISWIKQSSSRRGEGLPGDLNENVIRRLALTSGLVDVKVAALDHDWSALKLVHRKH